MSIMVHRKLMISFSRCEIQKMLIKRARALVLTAKDRKRYDGASVAHVEGEGVVTLWIREKDPQEKPPTKRARGVRRAGA